MSEAQKSPTQVPATAPSADLEIKDARIIFDPIWDDLEAHFGRQHLRFPKEIILLGGAPGAGKGTNTAFIAKTRGLTCQPIVMSSLLDTPEMKRIKEVAGDDLARLLPGHDIEIFTRYRTGSPHGTRIAELHLSPGHTSLLG